MRWLWSLCGSLIVAVPLALSAGGLGAAWVIVCLAIPIAGGFVLGVPFGRRERDVAFPMPVATAIAGLFGSLLSVPILVIALFAVKGSPGP